MCQSPWLSALDKQMRLQNSTHQAEAELQSLQQ